MSAEAIVDIPATPTTSGLPDLPGCEPPRPADVSALPLPRHPIRCLQSLPPTVWLTLDVAILWLGLYAGYRLFPPPPLLPTPHVVLWQAVVVFAFSLMIASLVFGLYEHDTVLSRSRLLTRMALTVAAASVIIYAIIYGIMYSTVSRRVAAWTMAEFFLCGTVLRLVACQFLQATRRGLLVVGPRALYESFVRAQGTGLLSEYRLVGYADTRQARVPTQRTSEAHLGSISQFLPRLGEEAVTDVVVGTRSTREAGVMDWVVPCLQQGCRVTNEAIFYEKATGQILVDEITPYWFLFADLKVYCEKHAIVKRVFDVVTAAVGLLLSAPLWPLIALAIRLGDGGPALYSQDRVGQNGRIFRLYKFRTMRVDAENGKSVWARPSDPRVTRVGRMLRRSRLDELPQLYNILVGQMSIVGPRPERPDIVRELSKELPYYAERHLVKPGLTGWAQISFRYGSTIEDAKRKLQFDLYYLKHMSFELDLVILLRTIGTFLRGGL